MIFYGINYNGIKPRPTYAELINVVDYPMTFPETSDASTQGSPIMNTLDGTKMMALATQHRKHIC